MYVDNTRNIRHTRPFLSRVPDRVVVGWVICEGVVRTGVRSTTPPFWSELCCVFSPWFKVRQSPDTGLSWRCNFQVDFDLRCRPRGAVMFRSHPDIVQRFLGSVSIIFSVVLFARFWQYPVHF